MNSIKIQQQYFNCLKKILICGKVIYKKEKEEKVKKLMNKYFISI